MPISPPIDPVAAHIGAGVLQIHVTPPTIGQVLKYQVQLAFEFNGPYVEYSNSEFNKPDGFINDLPLGKTIYVQVRAVSTDLEYSDWVQVKAGMISSQLVRMKCIAPKGSLIPSGSMFCVPKLPLRMIGFKATEDINFT